MRIALTVLAAALVAVTLVAVHADDPPKTPTTPVQCYLDGTAGKPHDVLPTDQVCGEVSSVPKFKYDYSGGRKDLGKISATILNIFKIEGEANKHLYSIMSTTGGSVGPGTELDFGKLPEGWVAASTTTGKRGSAMDALPAGTYLAVFVIAAAEGSGTVRVHFTVK